MKSTYLNPGKSIARFFVLLFLLTANAAYSQQDTLVISKGNKKMNVTSGEKVSVKVSSVRVKGQLEFLNDSTIRVDTETVALNDIDWIRARGATGRRIAGIVVTSLGSAAIAGAGVYAVVIYNRSYGGFLGGLQAWTDRIAATAIGSLGVIVTTTGILVLQHKKYKSKKWSYSIH